MAAPSIIAFDLSLRWTGVAHHDGTTHRHSSKQTGDARLAQLRDAVLGCATVPWADLVVIEGLALRANGGGHAELAGLHYLVRVGLWEREQRYVVIPPATLKKAATGRGNAPKPDLRAELIKRAGIDLADDNECDAWWLRYAALHHYGHAPFDVPQTHRDAIEKIDWPAFEENR
jgi:Holliday junction resolvasome RuvABC endonuclease subunit